MPMEKESELIDKIQDWLREQQYQFNVVQDTPMDLNLTFWPTPDMKLNAIVRNDSVTVTTVMNFTPKGVEQLSTISAESRKAFEQNLQLSLLPIGVDFNFVYDKKTFVGVNVYKAIFYDGLTKTKFFDTISTVLHSIGVISIKYMQLTATTP